MRLSSSWPPIIVQTNRLKGAARSTVECLPVRLKFPQRMGGEAVCSRPLCFEKSSRSHPRGHSQRAKHTLVPCWRLGLKGLIFRSRRNIKGWARYSLRNIFPSTCCIPHIPPPNSHFKISRNQKDYHRRLIMTGIPIPSNHRSLSDFSDPSLDMQSPYYPDSYSSSSSSPGGMDFFFYGSQPVYDSLCDLDPMSPFSMQEVAAPDVYNITSSPYYPTTHEFPVFERQIMPQSAPSCASSCASSSFNFPGEEIALPSYPVSVSSFEYESGSDSPAHASASKPAKPFGCDDCGKAFTRFADLKRHQSSVHYPIFRNCPVDHCSRKGSNGFPRQDHLVEHLRSYHHMNVPKRGGCKRAAKEIS